MSCETGVRRRDAGLNIGRRRPQEADAGTEENGKLHHQIEKKSPNSCFKIKTASYCV
jgi:hypothetical protein